MKKSVKLVLVLLLVGAAGAAYFFTRTVNKGNAEVVTSNVSQPNTQNQTLEQPPAASANPAPSAPAAKEQVEAPATEEPPRTTDDDAKEVKFSEALQADKELAKVANIQSAHCQNDKCIVEVESKDGQNPQMKMMMFLNQNREEFGYYSKFVESKENPRVTIYTISKEKEKL